MNKSTSTEAHCEKLRSIEERLRLFDKMIERQERREENVRGLKRVGSQSQAPERGWSGKSCTDVATVIRSQGRWRHRHAVTLKGFDQLLEHLNLFGSVPDS